MPHLLIHHFVDGHLNSFQFWTSMKNYSTKMSIQIFLWTCFHFSWVNFYITRSKFKFGKLFEGFSESHPFYAPTSSKSAGCYTFLPTLLSSLVFILAILKASETVPLRSFHLYLPDGHALPSLCTHIWVLLLQTNKPQGFAHVLLLGLSLAFNHNSLWVTWNFFPTLWHPHFFVILQVSTWIPLAFKNPFLLLEEKILL